MIMDNAIHQFSRRLSPADCMEKIEKLNEEIVELKKRLHRLENPPRDVLLERAKLNAMVFK